MKIVIIGGTGLIGSKLVKLLSDLGHDAVAASPNTGVNTITGEGLATVLENAKVVIDVANSPSFEDKAVMDFFTTSGKNLLAAEKVAGVGHHIALSIVGTERNPDSGYLRAKLAQEKLVKESGIPYSIVHSTQFFEFLNGIAQSATIGSIIYLPPALMQPIAADDVAAIVARVSIGQPLNGSMDIAGPDKMGMNEMVERYLDYTMDERAVVSDSNARYFGALLNDESIVPIGDAQLGLVNFEEWAASNIPAKKIKS